MRHAVGTPPAEDVLVFEEADEAFYVGLGRDSSEAVMYVTSSSAVTSETRWLAADDPTGEWKVVLRREKVRRRRGFCSSLPPPSAPFKLAQLDTSVSAHCRHLMMT